MNLEDIFTQSIKANWLNRHNIFLDVLRLDVVHPVVSGNKWFKLKYYLQEALNLHQDTIATFGGAFSNHIIATAYAAKQKNLKSIGFIRGEESTLLSPTLQYARALGMRLLFVSREKYQKKQAIIEEFEQPGWYFINEGGYGIPGAKGAMEILDFAGDDYTHIIASTGTGTMLAGLVMAANPAQKIMGISSMKGNNELENAVKDLLIPGNIYPDFTIHHDYHFGGYAKHPPALVSFVNEAWRQFQLPLDIVYTGKLFFAIIDLVNKNYFQPNSKLLMIHSGGLQGNNSLPKNQLSFS